MPYSQATQRREFRLAGHPAHPVNVIAIAACSIILYTNNMLVPLGPAVVIPTRINAFGAAVSI
jgi:hypothetical protein